MLNNEMQKVKILTYSNDLDDYGQKRQGAPTESYCNMVVHTVSQANVDNPKYVDIDLVGITETALTDDQKVVIGTKTYDIKYVIPPLRRYYQVLLRNE